MRKIGLNSAINLLPLKVEDGYDKINGFVFPLRFKPWLDYTIYDRALNKFTYSVENDEGDTGQVTVPTFVIKKDGTEMTNITDLTDYYSFNIPILPVEGEGYYFYYSEKNIYFNFDMIEAGNIFTVVYNSKSESISLSMN